MSVNVFGRSLDHEDIRRGPPGIGYKLTADGQFDLDGKRLSNVAAPNELTDAVTLNILQNEIRGVLESIASLRNDLNNLKKVFEAYRNEIERVLLSENIIIKSVGNL